MGIMNTLIQGFKKRFIQYVYWVLTLVGYYYYMKKTIPWIISFDYIDNNHIYYSICCILLVYFTYIRVALSDPGVITEKNIGFYKFLYPPCEVYPAGKECSTCHFEKLPRSKHCRVCNHCVMRFDHHCPWINNCVGLNNHKLFIYYVFTQWSTTVYLTYVQIQVFTVMVLHLEQQNFTREDGTAVELTPSLIFAYFFTKHNTLLYVFILCVTTVLTVFGLGCNHLYLTVINSTTAETSKYKQYMNFHRRKKQPFNADIMRTYSHGCSENCFEVFCPKYFTDQRIHAGIVAAEEYLQEIEENTLVDNNDNDIEFVSDEQRKKKIHSSTQKHNHNSKLIVEKKAQMVNEQPQTNDVPETEITAVTTDMTQINTKKKKTKKKTKKSKKNNQNKQEKKEQSRIRMG